MSYYVIVEECDRGDPTPHRRYLVALQYQPYVNGTACRVLSDTADDAFEFQERAAAELAAVFVGGEVEE